MSFDVSDVCPYCNALTTMGSHTCGGPPLMVKHPLSAVQALRDRAEAAERKLAVAVEALEAIVACDLELANGGYHKRDDSPHGRVLACVQDMGKYANDALDKVEETNA